MQNLGFALYWLHQLESLPISTSRVQWKLKPAASNEEEEEGGRKPNKGGNGDDDDVDVDVDVDSNDRCVDDDAKTGG